MQMFFVVRRKGTKTVSRAIQAVDMSHAMVRVRSCRAYPVTEWTVVSVTAV